MAVVRGLIAASAGGLLVAVPVSAQVATGTITGRVVDSTSSQPLPNVTVSVTGTQRGALTGPDGRFTITAVPAGAQQVRAARIGYGSRTQQVAVTAGQPATVAFSLTAAASALTEVVVVGYGAQRREAITGSVATVKADEANVGVVANANQLLTARVAGVNVVANNGEPGGGAQVRVRGGTSLSASNEPLYVVDGVPLQNEAISPGGIGINGTAPLGRSPLNSINPDDIANITVLKDASATAIYGSRGANGVVLIETKKGAAGQSAVEYEVFGGVAQQARTIDFLNGDQYRSLVSSQVALYTADSLAGIAAANRRGLAPSRLASLGTANTDWQDAINRNGYTQNHNLAFSGGSTNTQYRASLNFFDNQGVVIANGLRRFQGRLNGQTQALSGRLRLGLNLTTARVNNDYLPFENTGGFEGGVFANVGNFDPTRPVRVDSGYYEIGAGSQSVRNPVALAEQISDVDGQNRTLGNITASYQFLEGLTGQVNVGVDRSDVVRKTYFPIINPVGAQTNGRARNEERNLSNVNLQTLLTYQPSLGTTNELEVVGGYEYTEFDNSGFLVDAQNFFSDDFSFNNLSAAGRLTEPPTSYRNQSRLVSFFGRANYGFRNKYFLTGVLRYDGSTRLAPGNQWQLFPAVSASWRLSEEGFMRNSPFSNLALRAGYGLQGNQAVAPYATQIVIRADNAARYPLGSDVRTGAVATRNENLNLKWETSQQFNLGLDYGLFQNRLTGLVDVYQKNTRDLLLEIAVAQPAFVSTRFENVGNLRNRGVEATINYDFIQGSQTSQRSLAGGLVLAVERNEVTSLGQAPFILTGSVSGQGQSGRFAQRLIPGQPIGTFWGATYVGVNDDGLQTFRCNRTAADCVNGLTTNPASEDNGIIGNANPDFSLGLNTRGTFRRFDASWLWRAEVGRDVFNNTALIYATKSVLGQGRGILQEAVDDGTAVNESAKYSSRWIQDGSFVRLQNVSLGYNFSMPGFGGRSATTRVYVAGDNLLLFTPYDGYDPEVFVQAGDGVAGSAARGIDYIAYPRARTFTLGARLQF